MKKLLFSFLAFTLITSGSFAACNDCNKIEKPSCGCERPIQPDYGCKKQLNPCENNAMTPCEKRESCDRCSIEDDEYCVYNQCFFDKQFRKMKKELCLSKKQEACIDNIYKNFKIEMEGRCARYRVEKNKLLDMIECGNDCWKEQRNVLKEMRNEAKERCKDFRAEIKEQLCKNQYSDFRKFQRHEKKKMKKIVKYGAVYKFPCTDCCK